MAASLTRFRAIPWSLGLAAVLVWSAACAEPSPTSDEEPQASSREPVETRASVDKAVATTGDLITYRVVVDYDRAFEVFFPEPGADIAGFRIVDLGDEERVERGERVIEERWYRLRADLVGSYVLPPIVVDYRPVALDESALDGAAPDGSEPVPAVGSDEAGAGAGGGFSTVETSAIFVEVESVLPQGGEAQDIRGLKPLRRVDRPVPWEWIAGGALAAIAVAIGLWLYLRRRRRRDEIPPEPAHVVAYRALDVLRSMDFADPVEIRRFYFAVSEVVRTYVEGRFGLNATDLTTEEIVGELSSLPELEAEPQEDLRRFLLDTDRVKFADQPAGETDVATTYEAALGFVEVTMPRPEATELVQEVAA